MLNKCLESTTTYTGIQFSILASLNDLHNWGVGKLYVLLLYLSYILPKYLSQRLLSHNKTKAVVFKLRHVEYLGKWDMMSVPHGKAAAVAVSGDTVIY